MTEKRNIIPMLYIICKKPKYVYVNHFYVNYITDENNILTTKYLHTQIVTNHR